jgi:dipeptidyl aminopeptidase/acylaminoacyl peptidase
MDPETGDLALRDLATGKMRRLTSRKTAGEFAYFSVVSPDSRRVAYAWFNESGFYDLRLAEAGGASPPRILYRNPEAGFVQPSAFSPDGAQILTLLFRKDNTSQIALVSAADGAVRVLKSLNWVYPKKMDFSPDGRYIVYDTFASNAGEQRDIFLLAADGSSERRLVEHPANDLFPLWVRDGARVLFASDRGGTMDVWSVRVEDGKAAGPPELLKKDIGRFLPMGVTRAGACYFGLRTGGTDVHLGTAGGKSAPLPSRYAGRTSAPAWSAGGSRLAYLARAGTENFGTEARILVIRDMRTGEERALTPKLAHLENLAWSPDGSRILASGSDSKGHSGLFTIDVETAAVRLAVSAEEAGYRGLPGAWAADGAAVAYVSGHSVRSRDLATGGEKELYRAPEGVRLDMLALLPDLTGWSVRRANLLVTIPASGGPVSVGAVPPGMKEGVSLDPASGRTAFTVGAARSEVWVMENFLPKP